MTLPLLRRKAPAARRRIVAVTNSWKVAGPEQGRLVLVREPDGVVVERVLPDEHPALVRYLARAAA